MKVYAMCPECGNSTFIEKEFDDKVSGYECLACEEFIVPVDFILQMDDNSSLKHMHHNVATKVLNIIKQIDKQLNTSDTYALNAKAKDNKFTSIWEIQNSHIRDSLNELLKIIREID